MSFKISYVYKAILLQQKRFDSPKILFSVSDLDDICAACIVYFVNREMRKLTENIIGI